MKRYGFDFTRYGSYTGEFVSSDLFQGGVAYKGAVNDPEAIKNAIAYTTNRAGYRDELSKLADFIADDLGDGLKGVEEIEKYEVKVITSYISRNYESYLIVRVDSRVYIMSEDGEISDKFDLSKIVREMNFRAVESKAADMLSEVISTMESIWGKRFSQGLHWYEDFIETHDTLYLERALDELKTWYEISDDEILDLAKQGILCEMFSNFFAGRRYESKKEETALIVKYLESVSEPEAQKVIVGSEDLPLYMSGESLMVDLSYLGLRDMEFGLMAELVGAAGVALVHENEIIGHLGIRDVADLESCVERGGVNYVKFLSDFELSIYDEVSGYLKEREGCAVDLGLYSPSGRVEECMYNGGYVKSIGELLKYASYPDEVSSEWIKISNLVSERVKKYEADELERARRAREAEEAEKKKRFGKAVDKAILKVGDVLFGKRYPY